jgi:hypothetical protein
MFILVNNTPPNYDELTLYRSTRGFWRPYDEYLDFLLPTILPYLAKELLSNVSSVTDC